jgi:hypothetical protein
MSKIYQDIFDPERKKVFAMLSAFTKIGYLAGGTALALQLGHRISYDFDIFCSKPLSVSIVKKLRDIFGDNLIIRINNADFLLLETPNHVELNFVYYWFPLLNKTVPTTSLKLASIEDIAADKAYTVGRRAQWRDYVDLFYILKHNILTLDTVTTNAKKKYGPEFNMRLFLEQLVYWGDVESFSVKFLRNKYSTDEIQEYLRNTAKQAIKKLLKS